MSKPELSTGEGSKPHQAPPALAPPILKRNRRIRALDRARSQKGLVVALWAVLTVCASAAGVCALLVTEGSDRALSAAISSADGVVDSGSPDLATVVVAVPADSGGTAAPLTATTVVPAVKDALLAAKGPYTASVTIWASTPMLYLPGDDVLRGYLLEADGIESSASLVSGTWPSGDPAGAGTIDVAIPSTTAERLGVGVGSHLRLSAQRQHGEVATDGFDLAVVGVFAPASGSAWTRDPLRGRGYDPNYDRLPAYGPFVVAQGTLESRDAPVRLVTAVFDPDLAGDAKGVPALVGRLKGVGAVVGSDVAPGTGPVLVRVPLESAFASMREELSITTSLVLAVFLIVLALGMATAALVARVLTRRRAVELSLLRSRGASPAQLTRGAAAESLVLAALAVAAGAPLAVAAYSAIAVSPGWAGSWNAVAAPLPGVGATVAIAAAVGAVLPAALLVFTALPNVGPRGRRGFSGPLAKSGIDVMLAVLAAVAYLQLRAHVIAPGAVDLFLAVAPAVCAIALAALVARLIPLAARAADALARRGRGSVVPVAGWHVARGGASQGTFLVVLAAAVATLGVTFLGTWSTSQGEQALALVGADMVVSGEGGPPTAAALAEAAGGTVLPITDRRVVLGTRPDGVFLSGFDSRRADQFLRGRLPHGVPWSVATSGLTPDAEGAPLMIDGGSLRLTIAVTNPPGTAKYSAQAPDGGTVVPTVVLVDDAGVVQTVVGGEVAIDGDPHVVSLRAPEGWGAESGPWKIVAIDLLLGEHTSEDLTSWGEASVSAHVTVAIDGATSTGKEWDAVADDAPAAIKAHAVTSDHGVVSADFTYMVFPLSWQDSHLTLLSFPAANDVPVTMTEGLAHELGLSAGDRIAMTWDTTSMTAQLVSTVPYVPGHVREDAMIADSTSLHRALLTAGYLGPIADAWWVSAPSPGAAQVVASRGWGSAATAQGTATTLRDGPLRVPLRVGWFLAIAAAVVLAVAGSAAHATAEAQQRASTIARLRALGMPRRSTLAAHFLQHVAVTVAAVMLGTASGALLGVLLAPLLVVAPGGYRAIPPALIVWSPWPTAAAVGAIAVGGLLAGLPSALAVVRRSTVEALRAGEAT